MNKIIAYIKQSIRNIKNILAYRWMEQLGLFVVQIETVDDINYMVDESGAFWKISPVPINPAVIEKKRKQDESRIVNILGHKF